MQGLLNVVFFLVARTLYATYRIRVFHEQHRIEAMRQSKNGTAIFCVWHGNSFAATLAHSFQKLSPLCSMSKDGQMVSFLCRRMGLKPVSGSSSRGGKEARLELIENDAKGYSAAITVDGPRGPRHKTKAGVVDIARKTGTMMLPVTALADRYWNLSSWDHLKIPKPFSRVAVIYHTPIAVPNDTKDDAFEGFKALTDQRLDELETMDKAAFASWRSRGRTFESCSFA